MKLPNNIKELVELINSPEATEVRVFVKFTRNDGEYVKTTKEAVLAAIKEINFYNQEDTAFPYVYVSDDGVLLIG